MSLIRHVFFRVDMWEYETVREDGRLDKHNSINLPPLQVNCCPARTLLINEAVSEVSTPPCKQPHPIPQLPIKLLLHPLLSPSHLLPHILLQLKLIIHQKQAAPCSPGTSLFMHWSSLCQGQVSSWYYEKLGEPVWGETHRVGSTLRATLQVTTWFLHILLGSLDRKSVV